MLEWHGIISVSQTGKLTFQRLNNVLRVHVNSGWLSQALEINLGYSKSSLLFIVVSWFWRYSYFLICIWVKFRSTAILECCFSCCVPNAYSSAWCTADVQYAFVECVKGYELYNFTVLSNVRLWGHPSIFSFWRLQKIILPSFLKVIRREWRLSE